MRPFLAECVHLRGVSASFASFFPVANKLVVPTIERTKKKTARRQPRFHKQLFGITLLFLESTSVSFTVFLDLVRNMQGSESEKKSTNKVSFHAGQEIFHTVTPKGTHSELLTTWPKNLPFRDRTAKKTGLRWTHFANPFSHQVDLPFRPFDNTLKG